MVVVGARCAGSPLATLLARRGLRVCVLDRSRFPSETLSTHVIQPRGAAVLDRLGVLDAVLAAGAVPLTRFTLVSDEVRLSTAVDSAAFGAPSLSMRRTVLDQLLVNAAVSAGAEVRTGTAVTGLLWEDGRVAGVETGSDSIRARLVVGADGRHSAVARLVGAGEYDVAAPGRMFAWAYFNGVTGGEGHLRLGSIGDLNYVAGPTDGGLHLAAVCPPLAAKDAFLADRERGFMAGVVAWPELAELLADAERDGPIRLLTSWHGYFRQATGPGWALLGDAGNFKDPTPAQGIADAFIQAEQMADVVAGWVSVTGRVVTPRLTGGFVAGGAGAMKRPARCTGSPPTWGRPSPAARSPIRSCATSPRSRTGRPCCCGSSTATSVRRSWPPRAVSSGPPCAPHAAGRGRSRRW